MYHRPLVTHVTNKISQGIPKETIEAELLAEGWSKRDVADAFYYSAYPNKTNSIFFKFFHSKLPHIIPLVAFLLLVPILVLSFTEKTEAINYTISLPQAPESGKVPLAYGEQPALSNPDFFGKVKQRFIDEKAEFIEADLTTKILRVYKEGKVALEVPIDTEGKEGSWWETPAGLYKVTTKEKAHFSGMGHVWMPWSLNFQGNFYIHGRTYHNDGTLTSAAYTGGCIRLSTDNAEKVYNMIEVGTPVLVFEHSFSPDGFTYQSEAGPALEATNYLSADLRNNYVFTNKQPTAQVPIASLTKLMTALIATEYINLDGIATVPSSAIVYTSKARLKAGETYSVYQLLFPLLRESSNESAETIARYYGRDSFIKHMNDKAVSIGMTHTKFVDPSGAGAENVSTAEDLFMLAKYIYNNRSFIFNITSGKITQSVYGDTGFSDLGNFNDFITNPYFFGGKNGKTTAAQETNLTVLEVPVAGTKRPIVSIVLGSPDGPAEGQKLIDYTLAQIKASN
jgi:D-alanyl-D-alanine carboxypeptidase (penicillin-binding protein 5/6)